MLKYCLLFASVFIATSFVGKKTFAEEALSPQAFLALAKVVGACGVMDEMIDFQKKTKIEGGDQFVTRFWKTEAARRGMSVQEISDQCDNSYKNYEKVWNAFDDSQE